MGGKRSASGEGNEARIWRELNVKGNEWSKEDARATARKIAGHARGLGLLVKNDYIEKKNGRLVRTAKGDRHLERTLIAGQAAQQAASRSAKSKKEAPPA